MFIKSDQRSGTKIEVARGKNASQCYQELSEACDENALLYRAVVQWVKVSSSAGRIKTADLHSTGRPSIPQRHFDIESCLPSIDCG